MNTTGNHYDGTARFYDLLSAGYGLGRIGPCKRSQLAALIPGQRVLFAGAGSGAEAALAAAAGARVTVVELSPRMRERAARRFAGQGLAGVELLGGDILEHRRDGHYDAVVSHFFLNVFAPEVMAAVLAHLARQLRPGGSLLIADFAPARGPLPSRLFRELYFGCAVLTFRFLAGNALHRVYDYAPLLPGAGLELAEVRDFGLPGPGPVLFRTLRAVRPGG